VVVSVEAPLHGINRKFQTSFYQLRADPADVFRLYCFNPVIRLFHLGAQRLRFFLYLLIQTLFYRFPQLPAIDCRREGNILLPRPRRSTWVVVSRVSTPFFPLWSQYHGFRFTTQENSFVLVLFG